MGQGAYFNFLEQQSSELSLRDTARPVYCSGWDNFQRNPQPSALQSGAIPTYPQPPFQDGQKLDRSLRIAYRMQSETYRMGTEYRPKSVYSKCRLKNYRMGTKYRPKSVYSKCRLKIADWPQNALSDAYILATQCTE